MTGYGSSRFDYYSFRRLCTNTCGQDLSKIKIKSYDRLLGLKMRKEEENEETGFI